MTSIYFTMHSRNSQLFVSFTLSESLPSNPQKVSIPPLQLLCFQHLPSGSKNLHIWLPSDSIEVFSSSGASKLLSFLCLFVLIPLNTQFSSLAVLKYDDTIPVKHFHSLRFSEVSEKHFYFICRSEQLPPQNSLIFKFSKAFHGTKQS